MMAACVPDLAAAHNCTCRANGQDYEQGQILCIRGRLAKCDMNLNNSSWIIIAPTCPEANLQSEPFKMAVSLPAPPARN
ncbi:MAG: hypothetical protein ACK4S3_08015 [Parvibaculum sp.]